MSSRECAVGSFVRRQGARGTRVSRDEWRRRGKGADGKYNVAAPLAQALGRRLVAIHEPAICDQEPLASRPGGCMHQGSRPALDALGHVMQVLLIRQGACRS